MQHRRDEKTTSTEQAPGTTATAGDPESSPSAISKGDDIAIGLVGSQAQEIDPAMEAKVLLKIDWFLIPTMIVGKYMWITIHTFPSHTTATPTNKTISQAMD
jgi:hypothetical protein